MSRDLSRLLGVGVLLAAVGLGCSGKYVPPDEALARLQTEGGYGSANEYVKLGPQSTAAEWKAVAERYYPPAALDYFEDMDRIGTTATPGAVPLKLSADGVKGRNAWVMWTAGNEAWWDWVARHGYGTIDLLRLIDHAGRDTRFTRTGLLNEPGTRPPTKQETDDAHGVRYARPITDGPSARRHVEHRDDRGEGWHPADPKVYGYPTGVVGLRLYPNPEFVGEAKARWDADKYYADSDAGREYAARPDTVRPFRVGMSCGFCHIAPHPLHPPPDPERPGWEHLSNNIGNQFMRIRAVFGNRLTPDNYLFHVFDSQLPGAVDTSGYPSDNINNPNTINSFYALRGRVARTAHNPLERISGPTHDYQAKYEPPAPANPAAVPRVLLDGSDSVGLSIALSRVYLNIGTHHQQWIRLHNPILGFRMQEPFRLNDVAAHSLYWHATLLRVGPLTEFFLHSTDPMRLKDAPDADARRKHLRGTGLPWYTADKPDPLPAVGGKGDYAKGRQAFARGCIACHSSVQPGDRPDLEAVLAGSDLPTDRTTLRLTSDDRKNLARGDGTLPAKYAAWARMAVERPEFWEWKETATGADGKPKAVTVHNFLSIDDRIPVTVTHTNSARAAATNARHGHIWEDFASDTYREEQSGAVTYRDPADGQEYKYTPKADGPGYYRVPTLTSIWAGAPLLHNNALGKFNNDPSVAGRLAAFDDAIDRLLWPEKRGKPSTQWYWDGTHAAGEVHDAWYPGRVPGRPTAEQPAAAQRSADGGWVWRSSEPSHLRFSGPHLPQIVGGFVGIDEWAVKLLAWLPTVLFLFLGVGLLCGDSVTRFRQTKLPKARGLLAVVRGLLALTGLAAAVGVGVLLYTFWPMVELLDVGTGGSIPWLRVQAVALPVTLFVGLAVYFAIDLFGPRWRARLGKGLGLLCLVLAVAAAVGIGPLLAGRGSGVTLGPIPAGVPINTLANIDPDAGSQERMAALKALTDFLLDPSKPSDPEGLRKKFEKDVCPALHKASKCPDFVTDRGHDYPFMTQMTEEEKAELKALLKTF